tara:strand:- start:1429 stop:1953 length:525 start_codon:yes stop_codon:yes gene_type:complete
MRLLTKGIYRAKVFDHMECYSDTRTMELEHSRWFADGTPVSVRGKFDQALAALEEIDGDVELLARGAEYVEVDFESAEIVPLFNVKTKKSIRDASLVGNLLLEHSEGLISVVRGRDYIPQPKVEVLKIIDDKIVFRLGERTGVTTIIDGLTEGKVVPNSLEIPITWDDILGERI